jgi:hypothetical protein
MSTEFSCCHKDDIGNFREATESTWLEEIASDGLDPFRHKFVSQFGVAETRDRNYASSDSGRVGGAARESGQAWAHLAADTQDQKIAVQSPQGRGVGLLRAGESLFQIG